MGDKLYTPRILDHYAHPHNWGRLENPDVVADASNPSCGDQVRVEVALDSEGRVEKVAFEGEGCIVSMASTSIFTDHIRGKSLQELASLTEEDVLSWLGTQVGQGRRGCALLPLFVLRSALKERTE